MSPQPPDPAASGAGAGSVRPSTLPRSVIVLFGVAGVVVMGIGIREASSIVAPTMLALILTIAVLPVDSWARRHGWPGWLATLFALVAAYAILLVLLIGTIVCLIKLAELLPQYAERSQDLTGEVDGWVSDLGLTNETASDALQKVDPSRVADVLTDVLSLILASVGNLFFLVTVMFFFVVAVPGFYPRIAALRRTKPALAGSLARFVSNSQSYLIMTALFGAIVAVLDTAALWLLAIPLPLVWGFFSFITNFIPNIGFVIGVIPPALLALLDSGWQRMVLVLVAYSVLNVTIQTFIQPRYVGASVGLSAEVTFLSLVVWAFLLGPLGALLAVPMTLFLRALFIDADQRASWVAPLIDTTADQTPAPVQAREPEPAGTDDKPASQEPSKGR